VRRRTCRPLSDSTRATRPRIPRRIFALFPEHDATRLVSRNRIATPNASPPTRLFNTLFMEPGSLVMERKMLREIKKRAEHLAVQQRAEMLAR
jgi:hypothetical protein